MQTTTTTCNPKPNPSIITSYKMSLFYCIYLVSGYRCLCCHWNKNNKIVNFLDGEEKGNTGGRQEQKTVHICPLLLGQKKHNTKRVHVMWDGRAGYRHSSDFEDKSLTQNEKGTFVLHSTIKNDSIHCFISTLPIQSSLNPEISFHLGV